MREKAMRRVRKKQKNLLKLGDFLDKTLKRRKIFLDIADPFLIEAWNKSVGQGIAAQTYPFKFRNNTLFVKVSNSVWMQQLQFMKQDIIDKVNPAFGNKRVRNIYFSIGKIPLAREKTDGIAEHESYPLKERDRRLIRKSLECVPDKELRSIIKRVMTREIVNRRITEDEQYS
jgi:predicted nucleic acid-binding Zn ribbon protein